jgi:hypothetical protein
MVEQKMRAVLDTNTKKLMEGHQTGNCSIVKEKRKRTNKVTRTKDHDADPLVQDNDFKKCPATELLKPCHILSTGHGP